MTASVPADTIWDAHHFVQSSAPSSSWVNAPPFIPLSSQPYSFTPHPPASVNSTSDFHRPYSPDSWVQDLGAAAAAPLPRSRSRYRPPPLDLPHFDGDPQSWPLFIQTFKIQVHDAVNTDAERIAYLRGCLSPSVQQSIGEALLHPGLYQFALQELQRKHGSPQVISNTCVDAIIQIGSFKDGDFRALHSYSSSLRSVVATFKVSGHQSELYSSTTLAQLVRKLPPLLQSRWAQYSYGLNRPLSIIDLAQWIDFITMAERSVRSYDPHDFPHDRGRD